MRQNSEQTIQNQRELWVNPVSHVCVCVVFTKMCVAMQTRQRVCLRMRLCEWVSKSVSVCVRENGRHYVSDAVKWTDEKCSCRKICLPTKWHRWTFISYFICWKILHKHAVQVIIVSFISSSFFFLFRLRC